MNGTGGSIKIGNTVISIMKWSYNPKINTYDTTAIGSKWGTTEQGLMEGECSLTIKADTVNAVQQAIVAQLKSGTFVNHELELKVSSDYCWKFHALLTGIGNNFEANGLYMLEISMKQNGDLELTPWDKPDEPTSLAGTDTTGDVTITWTDAGAVSTSYSVFYKTGCAGTELEAAILAATEFTGTKSPAGTVITASGTKVGFVVAGVNANGIGAYAGPVFVDVA